MHSLLQESGGSRLGSLMFFGGSKERSGMRSPNGWRFCAVLINRVITLENIREVLKEHNLLCQATNL